MAVGSEEVKKHLELMGMYPLTAVQALEAWIGMRDKELPQYGLMNCNWSRWQEFEPTGGNSPRFSKLMDSSADGQESLLTGVCQEISQLPEQERAAAMGSALAEQVAKTLRLPTGKIDMQQSLTQMGVDSLMAAELQTAIHQAFGVRVSALKLMQGHSLTHLAEMLTEGAHLAAACGAQTHETSLVDRLSGEDVDILLNQLLMEEGK
jgi:acyl carrier protein